jgi:hypothetical protein
MVESSVLESFRGIYSTSSEFPPAAIERIPPSLLMAIDQGNETFFREFSEPLPQTYRAWVSVCGRVRLLERIAPALGLGGGGKERPVYWWGLECQGRLVLANIPVGESSDPTNREYGEKKLRCLPEVLHCFYAIADGMSISERYGRMGYDLPAKMTDWRELREYCDDLNIPADGSERIFTDFPGEELGVLVRGSRGDLVIVNLSRCDRRLLHVRTNNLNDHHWIENTPLVLDRYFASALRGFPEEVSFR